MFRTAVRLAAPASAIACLRGGARGATPRGLATGGASVLRLRSFGVGATPHAALGVSMMTGDAQRRSFQWNVFNPENWSTSTRHTNPEVEKELPEVFASQPADVDDYIRPEKTFFESVEDWWDYVISFMQPVEKQIDCMRAVQEAGLFGFDLGWGGTFMLWGVAMRIITLIPQLYAHRNSLRLGRIGPQLSEISGLQKRIKGDKTISTPEKRVIKEGYTRMKKALYKKHNCSQARSAVQGLASPFMVTAFLAVRRLATYDATLETEKFWWVTDLTMPDPTWMLPIACSSLFLLNFELNQLMNRGGRSVNGMYMRWAVRGGMVVSCYFFQSQPSAMFCYWIGMSTAGLLQPMLLRWQWFRNTFDFPDPPPATRAAAQNTPWSRLMVKLGRAREVSREQQASEEKADAIRAMQRIQEFDVIFDAEEEARGRGRAKAGAAGGTKPAETAYPTR